MASEDADFFGGGVINLTTIRLKVKPKEIFVAKKIY